MTNQILICSLCHSEYEHLYKDDEVVSQSPCKCKKVRLDKPLDKAILKLTEILNGKVNSSSKN